MVTVHCGNRVVETNTLTMAWLPLDFRFYLKRKRYRVTVGTGHATGQSGSFCKQDVTGSRDDRSYSRSFSATGGGGDG
jgi:hypothetical protein